MPSNLHPDKRPARGSFSLKTISAAVVSALVFSNAYAAGLGRLTVLSPLGQPLRAEIELTSVSKDEAGNLVAKLASPEAFRQANIDYSNVLGTLQFAVEQRGDRQFIRVSSTQPLNEPFVDMLLELSGPHGRLVREYTFLLDPADLRGTQSAQVAPVPVPARTQQNAAAASRPAPAASTAPAAPTARRSEAAPAPRAERQTPAAPAGGAEQYQVRNGDTLARIASQVRPSGVSLDQMLVALYRNNPDAFAGQNMNRLRAGQILSVPDADAARSVSADEARRVVVAQSADFNNYRSKLAGQVAESTAQQTAGARQGAGGKITASVEERATPASEAKDKLKLSNAAAAGAASSEDLIARDKALAEATARVKELERNVSDLQKLLEIKNKNLADQQKQADAANAAAPAAAAAASAPAAAPAASAAPSAPVAAAANDAPAGTPAAGKPATEAPAAEPPVAEKPADTAGSDKPAADNAAPAAAAVAAAKPAAPKSEAAAAPVPAVEPSFVDSLLENPLLLPGLGALLVALGGAGIYRARRQKQSKQFEDSLITDSSLKANSLFGSTGGQNVDTNNSVFNSSFSPSASQLDTNEVDPVAEADVYIAYGRDAQAEEILKEALRTQPERHAVRVKLLEIYSNRKDLRAFEVLATELYGMTKGEGDEWAQAAAMGAAIDPGNPLYGNAKTAPAGGEASTVLAVPTQPLDEQGLATLLAETQTDTGGLDADNTLETDSSYFSNTSLAAGDGEQPMQFESKLPELDPVPAAAPEAKASSNDLDFDLEGMNLPDMAVPNTIPRPMPAEPPAEIASIDFDFLDDPVLPKVASEPAPATASVQPEVLNPGNLDFDIPELPTSAQAPAQIEDVTIPEIQDLSFSLKDDASFDLPPVAPVADVGTQLADVTPLEIDIPGLPETPAADAKLEPAASNPMDFDLSGISLELSPAGGSADFGLDEFSGSVSASAVAEMATKLDLAIAYQEIGDKEGARELLDEVLKGGTPEQSERAKSLLLELA
ncbi:MAG TPA: FimV/HubP family polar landmark protein [Noviherbaspirillum sp.]|jgi:pilus assembly protein FimV|uniref:FimV/HubP family polar landmark protein n=1 Tax=Noviherbaspirillum sp. TaxID=1926288 RepID=UPI002F91D749